MSASLKDIIAVTSESIEQHGVFTKENFKKTFSGSFDRMIDSISKKITGVFADADDNVFVPSGTKTLLGEDFSSLYVSFGISPVQMSDGMIVDMVTADCPYETEMHSGYGMTAQPESYALLSSRERAVYEVVLLSKYAAFQSCSGGVCGDGQDLAEWYADKMSQYRKYCDGAGLDWDNDIIRAVSVELQTETRDYLADGKKFGGAFYTAAMDMSRVVSNMAHGMVVSCADSDFVDMVPPFLEQDISYEDTIDVVPKVSGDGTEPTVAERSGYVIMELAGKVKSFFVEKWNQLMGSDDGPGMSVYAAEGSFGQDEGVQAHDEIPDSAGEIFSSNLKNEFSGILDYEEEMIAANEGVSDDEALLAAKRGQIADSEFFIAGMQKDALSDTIDFG